VARPSCQKTPRLPACLPASWPLPLTHPSLPPLPPPAAGTWGIVKTAKGMRRPSWSQVGAAGLQGQCRQAACRRTCTEACRLVPSPSACVLHYNIPSGCNKKFSPPQILPIPASALPLPALQWGNLRYASNAAFVALLRAQQLPAGCAVRAPALTQCCRRCDCWRRLLLLCEDRCCGCTTASAASCVCHSRARVPLPPPTRAAPAVSCRCHRLCQEPGALHPRQRRQELRRRLWPEPASQGGLGLRLGSCCTACCH
jgi:hypothetical protein